MAARYDRKIAGAYLLLHYASFGQGIDQNGAKLDNVHLGQLWAVGTMPTVVPNDVVAILKSGGLDDARR